jgi:class 3 adenylate cyclase
VLDAVSDPPQLQFAHVLFLDIVGYSNLDNRRQLAAHQELQALVRGQPEYERASADDDLLSLPTGDGMALVFFREPVAPLRCAVQIARALREGVPARVATQWAAAAEALPLRMGIHSGPVYRVEDLNANANVSGGGINTAQRVMDCGEAGHILVSEAVARLVEQVGEWPLEDLGEYEVKHGKPLRVFNVYGREFGNPARPARQPAAGAASRRVVFLYRRGTQPDEQLLEALASHFSGRGCEVFWDRQIKVGMKWAEEIRRHIYEADAVIALVSPTSAQSEMLAEELRIAREAQERQGRPRLLPVRVGEVGPLPEGVAVVLDAIEQAAWSGPDDTPRISRELEEGLDAPAEVSAAARSMTVGHIVSPSTPPHEGATPSLEAVGGAVPLGSRFYVTRPSDAAFLTAIGRRDSIVLVNGARQMGKTSLLARGLQQAREAGSRVALTDFQWLGGEQLVSSDTLFRALGEALAEQLDLDLFPEDVWRPGTGASVNFQRYMRRAVLADGTPVVWGLDEADRLFGCSFASEVFGLFRSWHNARALDPSGLWSRLTMAIAYATEAHLFITDINQSPFNVGTRVALSDFTQEQVDDLNRRHGSPLMPGAEVRRYFELLRGHPYLTRRGLSELVTQGLTLERFEASAVSNEGPFSDHLRRILVLLAQDAALTEVVRGLVREQPCPTSESFYRLRSAGLVRGDSPREARLRCPLYATYLERHL